MYILSSQMYLQLILIHISFIFQLTQQFMNINSSQMIVILLKQQELERK